MPPTNPRPPSQVPSEPPSRRNFLHGAATLGATATVLPVLPVLDPTRAFAARPSSSGRPKSSATPPQATQVHLQYGNDPTCEMTVSWTTATSQRRPRVRIGTAQGGLGRVVHAETRSYVDGINGIETICHHARVDRLVPDEDYVYEIVTDAGPSTRGSFRTAPAGRFPFRFTSVGDLATPNTAWSKSSLNAATAVHQIEQFAPMFHLHNGDLSYANNNEQTQPQVWADFMNNIQGSAANRPWMTALGNHETEWNNGPLGYASYHTRFALPRNGEREQDWHGNWYSFRVGSVLFVSLDANDVVYQNDGSANPTKSTQALNIHGYSGGAQTRWLRRTLAHARCDDGVDWIVVFQHQLAMSSSSSGAGCDLGIRQQFMPLFDEYGVDLVLCGHDHDYERTYAVHGVDSSSDWLRPSVVDTGLDEVDTSKGHVHLVLGGGGTNSHDDVYGADTVGSNPQYGGDPVAQVYTDAAADQVYKADGSGSEVATWSAVRDPSTTYPWGLATFDVDPGTRPGGRTTIKVTYYHTPAATLANPYPAPIAFDSFTAAKQRRDTHGWHGRDGAALQGSASHS